MGIVVRMALAGFFALVVAMPSPAADEAALGDYIASLASEQDVRVAEALARIECTGRKLLALRSYLRSSAHLTERWSWTEAQIAAYQGSHEHQAFKWAPFDEALKLSQY